MKYETKEISYKSSNNINEIKAKIFFPENIENVKGIIQISHGMCEYIEEYEEFAYFLIDNGFIVCGNNHLGHGNSVRSEDEYGFFAPKYGYKYLIKDVYKLTLIMKDQYPNLRYILLGHSMGSFITRCYIAQYGNEINGVILSGTVGPNQFIDVGIKLANMTIRQKGKMYRSDKLTDLAQNVLFNKSIKHSTSKYDWLTRDVNVKNQYIKDKQKDFCFTASGYKDLFNLIKYANYPANLKLIPNNLPIYIFSGDKDPIGENGKGVEKVYEQLKEYGCHNVNMKLYHNGRHEMLNEINKDIVYNDIINWIDNKVINNI